VRELYTESDIKVAVSRLAEKIDRDFAGEEIYLLGVLTGSFLFLADLARALKSPVTVDFVRLSSYGGATKSSGRVEKLMGWKNDPAGKNVVVVEEIVDSGLTLKTLLSDLASAGAARVSVCALVDKRARREVEVPVDYAGFILDDGFLVGYGLDLDERYRNLPAICVWDEEEEL